MNLKETPWDLEDVIATPKLDQRKSRVADTHLEMRVTAELLRDLAKSPQDFFPKLTQAIFDLTSAQSAGISLLDKEKQAFIWPAVVGGLVSYTGGGTPSDFGPCGTVLERNCSILFAHPERHFTYLQAIAPSLVEVLLVPFHVSNKAVGTIWAVIHDPAHQFDREDRRILESLSSFAASAYRVLTETGLLESSLASLPQHPSPRPLVKGDTASHYGSGI